MTARARYNIDTSSFRVCHLRCDGRADRWRLRVWNPRLLAKEHFEPTVKGVEEDWFLQGVKLARKRQVMASGYPAAKSGALNLLSMGYNREASRYGQEVGKEVCRRWFIEYKDYCAYIDDCNSIGVVVREN